MLLSPIDFYCVICSYYTSTEYLVVQRGYRPYVVLRGVIFPKHLKHLKLRWEWNDN